MLEIKIKTGNEAFHEYEEHLGDMSKRNECIRILNKIIYKINEGYDEGNILDINGNTVGNWSLS